MVQCTWLDEATVLLVERRPAFLARECSRFDLVNWNGVRIAHDTSLWVHE